MKTTINNHPSRHDIIGKSKEELLNRRPYIIAAIDAWKKNKYDATPDRVAYNINYFEVELQIIDKELKKNVSGSNPDDGFLTQQEAYEYVRKRKELWGSNLVGWVEEKDGKFFPCFNVWD